MLVSQEIAKVPSHLRESIAGKTVPRVMKVIVKHVVLIARERIQHCIEEQHLGGDFRHVMEGVANNAMSMPKMCKVQCALKEVVDLVCEQIVKVPTPQVVEFHVSERSFLYQCEQIVDIPVPHRRAL